MNSIWRELKKTFNQRWGAIQSATCTYAVLVQINYNDHCVSYNKYWWPSPPYLLNLQQLNDCIFGCNTSDTGLNLSYCVCHNSLFAQALVAEATLYFNLWQKEFWHYKLNTNSTTLDMVSKALFHGPSMKANTGSILQLHFNPVLAYWLY